MASWDTVFPGAEIHAAIERDDFSPVDEKVGKRDDEEAEASRPPRDDRADSVRASLGALKRGFRYCWSRSR